jgi:hypothetical protein
MNNQFSKLILGEDESNKFPALSSYLNADLERAKKLLPGISAESDCETFQESIWNLCDLVSGFFDSQKKQISVLSLGKIQSGKTSHMLGVLSWAIDTNIGMATIFTGITSDLNRQTINRLRSSLGKLDPNYINVHEVPTNSNGIEYTNLIKEIFPIIQARISRKNDEEAEDDYGRAHCS